MPSKKKKTVVRKPKRKAKASTKKAKVKKLAAPKAQKPIGSITHYFTNIKVGIIKLKKPVRLGDTICFRGHTTDFCQPIKSMQYDHKDVAVAPKGKEIGLKVAKRVRVGDEIFLKKD